MIKFLTRETQAYSLPEFDNHSLVSFIHDRHTGMEGFIALHRKSKLPSFGATRLWTYDSHIDGLKDALRLSKIMSYKAALAGLGCGGAKGVIFKQGTKEKDDFINSYAKQLPFFNDLFITGTDVGLDEDDVIKMRKYSKNVIGLNKNATEFTALGLYHSIKYCAQEVFGSEELEQRPVAIQGMGKIGSALLALLYQETKNIFITDTNQELLEGVVKKYPGVTVVKPNEIHKQLVDIYAPCALSHSLTTQTITKMKCRIVAGGANNQLENDSVGELLHKLGILYAPDYVINAGGLISVFDEYENKDYVYERVFDKVINIKKTLTEIVDKSKKYNKSTHLVANEMAEKIFNQYD